MASHRASVDTSRRTFRGNAGPTDRRLNKHQARRRKAPTRTDNAKPSKYENDKQVDVVEQDNQEEYVEEEHNSSINVEQQSDEEESSPVDREAQHLLRRISNIRESIQLSAAANTNPSTWQQNVLNPVKNCVGEWRAIVSHYQNGQLDSSDNYKEPSRQVYELIQMSMQSGPLAGAKPGYFKRCGSSVARQALEFLDSTVPDRTEATFLHLSEKQADAIDKWRSNAKKAVENDKPPSKSALKKQQKTKSKK